MRLARLLPVAVLTLAVLSACRNDKDAPAGTDPGPSDSATSAGSTASPPTSPGASTPATTSPKTSPTTGGSAPTTGEPACPASHEVPDGTWQGPLTLDVRGVGGTAEFTDTPSTGSLTLVVDEGKVVDASWSVGWSSQGQATSGTAKAVIRVAGSLRGTGSGTAARPVLDGTWQLNGYASIKVGTEQSRAPIDDSGPENNPLRIRSADCRKVTGSFTVDFTSKTASARFTGKGSWVAEPTA